MQPYFPEGLFGSFGFLLFILLPRVTVFSQEQVGDAVASLCTHTASMPKGVRLMSTHGTEEADPVYAYVEV